MDGCLGNAVFPTRPGTGRAQRSQGVPPLAVGVHLHRASYLELLHELDTVLKLKCHLITPVTLFRLREVTMLINTGLGCQPDPTFRVFFHQTHYLAEGTS